MANEFRSPTEFLRGVTLILGLDQSDDGLTRMAEELQISVDPVGDVSKFDFALPRGEYFWADTLALAAGGPAVRSIVQIHNDSVDHLVRIDAGSQFDGGPLTTRLNFARTSTLATTDVGLIATPRDGRYPRAVVPAVRFRSQNNAALPAGFSNGLMWSPVVAAGALYTLPWSVLLRPGGTFAVWPDVDNSSMIANFTGSVRRALKREITV